MDPHEVLNVPWGAPAELVRAAYKRAALESHPDKGGTKEAFQRVVLAFEQLSGLNSDGFDLIQRPKPEQSACKRPKTPQHSDTARPKCEPQPPQKGTSSSTKDGSSKCDEGKARYRNFPEELRQLLQEVDKTHRRDMLQNKMSPWQRHALEQCLRKRKEATSQQARRHESTPALT
eukprot:229264-Amphidinium_carterae.1